MKAALKDLRRCVQLGARTFHRHGFLFFGQSRYPITSTVPADRKKAGREYSLGEIWVFVVMNLLDEGARASLDTRELEELVEQYGLRPITDNRVQSTIELPDSLMLFFHADKPSSPRPAARLRIEFPPGETQSLASSSTANKTCLIEEEVLVQDSCCDPRPTRAVRQTDRHPRTPALLPKYLREIQEGANLSHLEDLRRIRQQELQRAPGPKCRPLSRSFRERVAQMDRMQRRGEAEPGGNDPRRPGPTQPAEPMLLVPGYSPKNLLNFANCCEFFGSGVLNLADFSGQPSPKWKALCVDGDEQSVTFRVFSSLKLLAAEDCRYTGMSRAGLRAVFLSDSELEERELAAALDEPGRAPLYSRGRGASRSEGVPREVLRHAAAGVPAAHQREGHRSPAPLAAPGPRRGRSVSARAAGGCAGYQAVAVDC